MEQKEIEAQLEELGAEINRVARELVRNSPVAQNLMGQQAALQRILGLSPAASNGKTLTEEQVLEEVE